MFPLPDDVKRHALLDDMVVSLRGDQVTTPTPGTSGTATGDYLAITEEFVSTSPPPPPQTGLHLFSVTDTGRQTIGMMGRRGIVTRTQSRLIEVQSYISQAGVESTTLEGWGFVPATAGTATARSVSPSSSNMISRLKRVGYVSAATANSFANWRHDKLSFFRGASDSQGGFDICIRFGISAMTTTTTDARIYVGFGDTAGVAVGTLDLTTTGTNHFGFACGSGAGKTLWEVVHASSTTRTNVNTTLPRAVLNDVYEAKFYCEPGGTFMVGKLTNLTSGAAYEYSTGASANIASATTPLNIQLNICNGAGTQAVAFDFIMAYAEVYGL